MTRFRSQSYVKVWNCEIHRFTELYKIMSWLSSEYWGKKTNKIKNNILTQNFLFYETNKLFFLISHPPPGADGWRWECVGIGKLSVSYD